MSSFHSESIDRLYRAILSLRSEEECAAFFEDICTIMEIRDMAQRLETAILLKEGMNYQTISKKLGISTTTISRVSRCLNYGSGGYQIVLDRLQEPEKES